MRVETRQQDQGRKYFIALGPVTARRHPTTRRERLGARRLKQPRDLLVARVEVERGRDAEARGDAAGSVQCCSNAANLAEGLDF